MTRSHVLDRLFAHTQTRRIPLICTFELTKACNLRCQHCYIPENERRTTTLSTEEIITALTELARMGTLYLVFTGGEIFLRNDLMKLCQAARALHFDLRLFTNGTLITKQKARQLATIGVSAVEISLYGRPATHDAITGTIGSWHRAIKATTTLRNEGVTVVLKMPLMTLNIKDRHYVTTLAKRLKVQLKLDAIITPKSDGDTQPLSLRIPGARLRKLLNARSATPHHPTSTEPANLLCSAGRNMLSIEANGTLLPCIQLPLALGNITKHPITTLWRATNPPLKKYLSIKTENITTCKHCPTATDCQRCPGLALLENGSLHGPSTTACLISRK